MARVYASTTPAEVEALLDGLPALATGAPVPVAVDSFSPAPRLRERLVAIMGGVELDLRQAELPPGVTEISAFVLMGGLVVRVPPGVRLETDGFAFMGGFEDRMHESGA